jgi:hypothetical protein
MLWTRLFLSVSTFWGTVVSVFSMADSEFMRFSFVCPKVFVAVMNIVKKNNIFFMTDPQGLLF